MRYVHRNNTDRNDIVPWLSTNTISGSFGKEVSSVGTWPGGYGSVIKMPRQRAKATACMSGTWLCGKFITGLPQPVVMLPCIKIKTC